MGGERILEGEGWLRQCNRAQVEGERTLEGDRLERRYVEGQLTTVDVCCCMLV